MSLRFFWKDNNLGIVINNVLLPSVVLQTAAPPTVPPNWGHESQQNNPQAFFPMKERAPLVAIRYLLALFNWEFWPLLDLTH